MNDDLRKYISDFKSGEIIESVQMSTDPVEELEIQTLAMRVLEILQDVEIRPYSEYFPEILGSIIICLVKRQGIKENLVVSASYLINDFYCFGPTDSIQNIKQTAPFKVITLMKTIDGDIAIAKSVFDFSNN